MKIKRILNKYLNDIQSYVLRNSNVVGYPTRICIDSANTCQLSCPLCPTGQRLKKIKPAFLKFSDYIKLMDEIGDYLYKITFYNWGEPLLNPDLFKCIHHATKKGIRTHISSNLNYYNDEIIESIVQSGLYKISIGLDGATQETYEKYRQKGDLNKVIEGIKRINEMKQKYNSKYPILVWQYILMKQNESEVEEARKMAKDLGMRFRVKALSLDELSQEDKDKWYPENPLYRKADHNDVSDKPYIDRCLELWNSPVINGNGDMFTCSYVYGDDHRMGNVFNDGFKKVWNNPKMKDARKIVMGKIQVSDHKEIHCSSCIHRKSHRSISELIDALGRKGTARRGIVKDINNKKEYADWNNQK
ncbi:radical SAM protein [Paenibacillus periandrae]|uniref:radical SAM protein n=1 Tax=Paenibacillus periandrae TaxID=1761741 RepID=UPI001F097314